MNINILLFSLSIVALIGCSVFVCLNVRTSRKLKALKKLKATSAKIHAAPSDAEPAPGPMAAKEPEHPAESEPETPPTPITAETIAQFKKDLEAARNAVKKIKIQQDDAETLQRIDQQLEAIKSRQIGKYEG